MRFQVLSHAGLLIESTGSVLICDPWLVGSVYWRSWWNYPPVSQGLIESLRPDSIYLTHIHWDHFQGISLRKFDRATPVFVPKSPSDRRMVKDLADLGFSNVVEIAHGTSVRLDPQFVITSYHFGLCPDSVLVAECEGITLVNANDAKLMGPPLRQLLARHMPIDFVFRSHSSANSRLCHEITDDPGILVDDPAAYVRDFAAFARATGARHAIPFASNHCYLHDETFGFNDSVTTPADVALHGASEEGTPPVTIMVSGDGWSSEQGFELTQHDYFANRAAHLRAYRDSQLAALESSAAREAAAPLDFAAIEQYFAALFDAMPFALRLAFRRSPVAWVLQAGDRSHTIETDFYRKTVRLREHPLNIERHIEVHVSLYIFQHCITAALFSLMPISKRARFRMQANQMRQVTLLKRTFNLYERGYLPMRRMLSVRFLREWARRWRELLLYAVIASRRLYGRRFRYSDYLRMLEPMTSAAPNAPSHITNCETQRYSRRARRAAAARSLSTPAEN